MTDPNSIDGEDAEHQRREEARLTRALVALIELQAPIWQAASEVEAAIKGCGPWLARTDRLAALDRDHLRAVIQSLLVEEISGDEVRVWARTFQGRTAWVKGPVQTTRPLILVERGYQVAIGMVLKALATHENDRRAFVLPGLDTPGLGRMLAVLDCENPQGPDETGPFSPVKAAHFLDAWMGLGPKPNTTEERT